MNIIWVRNLFIRLRNYDIRWFDKLEMCFILKKMCFSILITFFQNAFHFERLNKKWVVWQGCHAKKPNLQNIFTNTLKTIFRMSKKQEVLISNIFYNIYKGPMANQFIFWEIVFKKAKCQPWCLIHSEQQHSRLNSVSWSS